MPAWLADAFGSSLQQRALLEVVLLSLACGPLGVWVVLYREAYAAESLAHAMLPGLVLAALLGVPLLAGGAVGLLAAAALIWLAGRDERLGADTGVAVAVTGRFGLGAMLALAPEVPARLEALLFGDLLGVTSGDLWAAAFLAVIVTVVLAAAHRPLLQASFRGTAGRPAALVVVLVAATTLVAVQGLGNLLVVALLVAPGAGAALVTQRLARALLLSVPLAASAGLIGLLASFHLGIAAGASVALSAVLLHLLCRLCAHSVPRLRRPRASAAAVAMVSRQ